MDESEVSDEELEISSVVSRYVVEINDVPCTLLYPGQTLAGVSQKYDIPKHLLLKYNEVSSENDIPDGGIVFLEKKRSRYNGLQDYYRVKEGDTLYSVSQQFGILLTSLLKMNKKNELSTISPGEKLRLK